MENNNQLILNQVRRKMKVLKISEKYLAQKAKVGIEVVTQLLDGQVPDGHEAILIFLGIKHTMVAPAEEEQDKAAK